MTGALDGLAPVRAAPRIGFADAHDSRIAGAVNRLLATGDVLPVVVGGDPASYSAGVEHVAVPSDRDPLTRLADLVVEGVVEAGVAGSLTTSADVLRAVIRSQQPLELVSSCFALQHQNGWVTYADCAVIPEPTVEQLAAIARMAAVYHQTTFGEAPRVAMLSFSTGSADHERVDRVREATQLIRTLEPTLLVDGEMQFDVAVNEEVGRRKLPGSPVAGRATVLVFPSLEAGNIAYKAAERIGGARALGSFVLGLHHPWVDLSRGCSTDDIVGTVRLLGAQLRGRRVARPILDGKEVSA